MQKNKDKHPVYFSFQKIQKNWIRSREKGSCYKLCFHELYDYDELGDIDGVELKLL